MCRPLTGAADAFHPKPARIVEKYAHGWNPRAEKKARQVADKHERAQRNGENVRGTAARR